MCGGDLSEPQMVSEQYLLDLEREAFLSLCGEKKTLGTDSKCVEKWKAGKELRHLRPTFSKRRRSQAQSQLMQIFPLIHKYTIQTLHNVMNRRKAALCALSLSFGRGLG